MSEELKYASLKQIESLPTVQDLEQIFKRIVNHYEEFLTPHAATTEDEIKALQQVVDRLQQLQRFMANIYSRHL